MRISIKSLHYFLSAAERRSISKAAEALNVVPSAVSSAIELVEAEFELKKGARINLAASEPTIYDVWTPDEQRGKGHYKKALSKLTDELLLQHANVWIYCLETNTASSRGILQTGFELQRSMTVKYYLGRQSKLELH